MSYVSHKRDFEAAGFKCPHCGQGPFPTREALRKHIFDNHMSASRESALGFASSTTNREDSR